MRPLFTLFTLLFLGLATATGLHAQDWTKPKLQKLYLDFLKEEGYVPELDKDGDITFERQKATFLIIINEQDPTFFMLALANIWKIENDEERARVMVAANLANNSAKVAKTYITEDGHVWVTVEMFLDEPKRFKKVLTRSLRGVDNAVAIFAKKMQEDE